MRLLTSRKLMLCMVGLIVLAMFATNAQAAEIRWNAGGGNFQWTGANWEDTAGAPVSPPAAGDKIVFDDNFTPAGNCGIDMAGATINLPGSSLGHGYGGRNWSYYDSATLTPNANPMANPKDFDLGSYASLEAASSASTLLLKVQNSDWSKSGTPRFFLPVEITGTFKTPESGTLEFYGPATINHHAEPRNKGWQSKLYFRNSADITTMDVIFRNGVDGEDIFFHGATTIATLNQDGGEVFFEPGSSATITNFNFTRGTFVTQIVPTITNMNWTGGIWAAGADGALPSTTPFSLGAGQTLRLDAAQTASPMITVGAGGALAGDMTNLVYSGAGQNVLFQNDAVHAPIVGTGPTLQLSDLAAGVGVWQGVTTKGAGDTWQAGLDGTSPYKGLAFDSNAFTPSGETRSTFKANTDSGDLLVRVSNLLDCEYRGPFWIGDGTSTTANFTMVGPTSRIDLRRHLNQGADDTSHPDRILTFNIARDTPHANDILTTNQQPGVYADQTVNISGGKVKMSAMITRFLGNMTITDGILERPDDFTATDTGTLTLGGKTFVEMTNPAELATFEALGDRLVYPTVDDPDGRVTVALAGSNGTYDIDYSATGATPVLAGLLQNADITRTSYKATTFVNDLPLGNGKFLYNLYERTNGNPVKTGTGAEIVYAGNGPMDGSDWIGFAAMKVDAKIDMAVDSGMATIQVGTADPSRLSHRVGGPIVGELPTKKVIFQQAVTTPGVNVQSGIAQFNQDLAVKTLHIGADSTFTMASGKMATVNERLSGNGVWNREITLAAGGVVAPGDSIGTLTGGTLIMETGSTYEWEVTDPDGAPGVGFDFLVVDSLNLDPDGDGTGVLNLALTDLDLLRDIETDEEFIITVLPDANAIAPTAWTAAVTAVPDVAVWDVSAAQVLLDIRDIGGTPTNVLYLTGVSATVSGVPEPTSLVLLALGALGLLWFRQRRRP